MVQEIGRLIETINREQGLSIVLVEQNANLALRLCHYAYVLENGRIALSGPGAELARSDYVQRAYLGARRQFQRTSTFMAEAALVTSKSYGRGGLRY
jgi:ABC-type lipopolysaccharide export system ATPase subunit